MDGLRPFGLSRSNRSYVARGSAIPPLPFFLEKISCLAGFLGETGDSGQGPGLDEKAKRREI